MKLARRRKKRLTLICYWHEMSFTLNRDFRETSISSMREFSLKASIVYVTTWRATKQINLKYHAPKMLSDDQEIINTSELYS